MTPHDLGKLTEAVDAISSALYDDGYTNDAVVGAASDLVATFSAITQPPNGSAAMADTARAMYANDDLEIDANPATSAGDDGTWVAAWVWVPDSN